MAEGNTAFGTDGIVATTLQNYAKSLPDQVFKRTVLLHLLGGQGNAGEGQARYSFPSQTGRSIVQPLLYGDQAAVGSFDDDDIFDAPSRGGITAAEYPWKHMYGSVFFTGEEMAVNSGPEAAVSLLKARLSQVERTMAKALNAMLFGDGTGNSSKDLQGLAILIDNAGTLGGIDRSDALNAWWDASETALGTALTLAAMRAKYNDLVDGVEKPSHIITTQAVFEQYEALMEDTIRHEDTDLGDMGFDSLMFKSTPVVFDRDCQSGVAYFLNLDYIELVTLAGEWFKPSGWLVPVNQDGMYKNIILRGNLTQTNGSLQGKITTIS